MQQFPSFSTLAGSKEQLIEKILSVLNFSIKAVKHLKLNFEKWDEVYEENIRLPDKLIAETAILALLIFRVKHLSLDINDTLNTLCELLIPLSRTNAYRTEILRSPQTVVTFGLAHMALSKLGYVDENFNLITINAFNSDKFNIGERTTYRNMDLRWIEYIYKNSLELEMDDLIKSSIISSNASALDMTREDQYALTHSLFYISDFGNLKLNDQIDIDKLNTNINGCIAKNLLTEDLDILGELLISSLICDNQNSFYFKIGIEHYINAWNNLGFLYSPSFSKKEFSNLADNARTTYVFKNLYHTYYVGGIFSSLLLLKIDKNNFLSSDKFTNKSSSLVDFSINESIKNIDRISERAFAYCKQNMNEYDSALNEMVNAQLFNLNDEYSIKECVNKYLQYHTHLKDIYLATQLSEEQAVQVILDCLLIENVTKYNLPDLCSIFWDFITYKQPISHLFLESVNFFIRQELLSGSITGCFFSNDNCSEKTKYLFELRVAYCLTNVSDYLRHWDKNHY